MSKGDPTTDRETGILSAGNKSLSRQFLLLFLPLCALIVAGAVLLARSSIDAELIQLRAHEERAIHLGNQQLQFELAVPIRHILALSRESTVIQTINGKKNTDTSAMVQAFSTLISRNLSYDQVRWLGEDGRERARVNNVAGKPAIVPDQLLQDKSDRYYFKQGLQLAAGEVYLSPMDLNIENGRVQVPYKPMVRMAVRLRDAQGQGRGVLVLNVMSRQMLKNIGSRADSEGDPVMLLNQDGFWLRGATRQEEWGFMLGNRDATLGQRSPQAWREISASQSGQVELSDGLWTWHTFDTSGVAQDAPVVTTAVWKLVTHIPAARLTAVRYRIGSLASLAALGLLAIAGFIGWRFLQLQQLRHAAEMEASRARREAEVAHQIQEAEALFRHVVEGSPNGIVLVDAEGNITLTNPRLNQIFDYAPGELTGRPIEVLVPESMRELHQQLRTEYAKWPEPRIDGRSGNFYGQDRNGRRIQLEIGLNPLRIAGRDFVLANVIDISARVRLEEEKDLYVSLVRNSSDFIAITDLQGRLQFVNEAGLRMVGLSSLEAARAYSLMDLIHPEDRHLLDDDFLTRVRQSNRRQTEIRFGHFGGAAPLWMVFSVFVITDAAGKTQGFASVSRNITAQHEAALALEDSRRHWQNLAESMPQLVWTCDAEGQCDYISRQWVEYTGIDAAPQLGLGWLEQVHPDDKTTMFAAWQKALDTGIPFDVEFRIRRHDGVYRWFMTRARQIRDDSGRIIKWYGSNTDIEDIKQSEARAREGEQRLQTIYDTAPVSLREEDWGEALTALAGLARDGIRDYPAYFREHPDFVTGILDSVRVLKVNHWTLKLHGARSEADLLGPLTRFFASPETRPGFEALLAALAGGQDRYQGEMLLDTLQGHTLPVMLSASLVSDGGFEGQVFVAAADISEITQARQELDLYRGHLEQLVKDRTQELEEANLSLYAANERFRSSFEWAAIGMTLVSREGAFLQVNPALCHILGYDEDELRAMDFQKITHPDDLETDLKLVRELLDGKRDSYQMEKRYFHKDGRLVWALLSVSTVRDSSGDTLYFISQIQDISERKHNEELLVQRERFLRAITDGLPGMVGYWDTELRCRFANVAYRTWFGRTPQEMIGTRIQDVLGDKLFRQNEPYIHAALRGEPQHFERTLVKVDGQTGYTWAHYIPDIDNGVVRGFFVLISDITELKEAQRNLEELNVQLERRTRQAEAASKAKSDFVANMSHELRSPMNAILGLTQLLDYTELNARQHDYLNKINSASKSLLYIINDILDYSKIEAGRLELEIIAFHLEELLGNLSDLFVEPAKAKGLKLELEAAPDVPTFLEGDPMRLGQILNNLVSNALKFTPAGKIHVRVAAQSLDGDEATLRFSVQDTGIGISTEQIANIFQPFTQADTSTTRRFGGTGLGLAIASRLLSLMNGKLEVESAPGAGSTFHFSVKLRIADDERAGAVPPVRKESRGARLAERAAAIRGARLLVAEDSPLNQEVAESMLRQMGIRADLAGNGREAVEMAAAGAYDAILMDLQMPEMDGFEATNRIRASTGGREVPIIAVTASALEEDRIAALQAGMNGHVSKPIDFDQLLTMLLRFIPPRQTASALSGPAPDRSEPRDEPLPPGMTGFDLAAALSRLGRDHNLLARTLRRFAREFSGWSKTFAEVTAKRDRERAVLMAHTLKGAAGEVGAVEVQAAAGRMESALRAGNDADAANLTALLDQALALIRQHLPEPAVEAAAAAPFDPKTALASCEAVEELLSRHRVVPESLLDALRSSWDGSEHREMAQTLLSQVDRFDFTGALKTLRMLKEAVQE